MKVQNKGKLILAISIFLGVFTAIPCVSGQQSYNIFTLEYFKQSLECLIIGDYDNAIFNSTIVIARDPESSVAYTVRARAYYERGDMNSAINDCTRAIGFDRNNISALSIRANAYIRVSNFARAITDWETILRINPENMDAQQNIDLARRQQASQ